MIIYLKLESYLSEWLVNSLGNPVRFPAQSYENCIISRYLSRRPEGLMPDLDTDGKLPIVIPDNSNHRPEYYNYFGRRGQVALSDAIENLFRINLWSECAWLITARPHGRLNSGIDEWCAAHGIQLDHREAVRQKFYRMRKKYASSGIILGNFHRKSLPQEWQ